MSKKLSNYIRKENAPVSVPFIVISGGGTAGHANPALTIASGFKEKNPEYGVLYIGSEDSIEERLAARENMSFAAVKVSPFYRGLKSMATAEKNFIKARSEIIGFMKKRRPAAVIGTGGYVSAPVISAAKFLKVPVLIHEQNVYPGRSNRLMSRGADTVCISFEASSEYFKKARKIVFSGNPVKDIFFKLTKRQAREELNIKEDVFFVLISGGSGGAASINRAALDMLLKYASNNLDINNIKFVLSAGRGFEKLTAEAGKKIGDQDFFEVYPYIYNMASYMAAADLIISRAGAISCAEISALGKASVLLPFPHAAGDHQRYNAEVFLKAGAAELLTDKELSGDRLCDICEYYRNNTAELHKMEKNAHALSKKDSLKIILNEIEKLTEKKC